MREKSFGAVFLGSLLGVVLFGGFVTYKAHEAVSTAGRTFGIVAKGFVPAKTLEDPEQVEDLANVVLDEDTSKKVLAQGK